MRRRTFLADVGLGFTGLALGATGAGAQSGPPGPSVPADTGAVQGGKVMFPNWRGPGDRAPPPPPAPRSVPARGTAPRSRGRGPAGPRRRPAW